MYNVITTPEADEGFARLAKDEPKAFLKAQRFLEELKEHRKTTKSLLISAEPRTIISKSPRWQ